MLPKEGIYFFGGKDANNVASDKLWMLKIYQNPAEFVLIEPQGKRPVGRYGHSLSHIENSPYLVLFGGRNDSFFKIFTHKTCFAFLDVLDIEKNTWIKVNLGTYKPQSRYGFCSAIHGSRLLVFGGLTDHNYLPAQMERLEFDSQKVEHIIKMESKVKNSYNKSKISIDPDIPNPIDQKNQTTLEKDDKSRDYDHKSYNPRNLQGPVHVGSSKRERLDSQDHGQATFSYSLNDATLITKNSYQPVPISVEQRMRHVHGSNLIIRSRLI